MSSDVVNLLRRTLDPASARSAEAGLHQAESQPGFASNLLQLISTSSVDLPTRQAGVLFFKNYIKRRWTEEDASSALAVSDKQLIKQSIVPFMTQMPPSLQVQIGEAVTIIANSDFPAQWQGLIDDLVSHINTSDMSVTNGVLQTAHSIFKRWRAQFRSDELFTEIGFVLSRFCDPFLALFKQTNALISENASDKIALETLMETMILLTKVFYDLNSQDIPEFFEDHMVEFMEILHNYMLYDNSLLNSADEDTSAGPVQRLKASICEIVELYTHRYEEVFPMLPQFVNTTWNLLTQLSLASQNDILVSKALSFLTCVVRIPRHAQLFETEVVLKQVIESIIIPNMSLREADQELFEDDPIEFIRRDLEGSDNDTRRRAATEFVRGLVEKFEQSVTAVVLSYVGHYLNAYNADPTTNWRSKDTASYLVTSVAVKGVVTKMGVTSTNPMIDIAQFFSTSVLPDLKVIDEGGHPILKVDAIKYVYTFRNQLSRDHINVAFPLLVQHLKSSNYVVFTYAAVTVDALLTAQRDGVLMFKSSDISPILPNLLQNLFNLIERGDSPEKMAENDFLIRCVMRVLYTAQEKALPHTPTVVEHLNKILAEVGKNPSNPRFNHYLFECYGTLIKFIGSVSPEAVKQLESMLIGPFLTLLQQDVAEFVPYVFQLLSQLLESHTSGGLPESYQQLLKPILTPTLWDSRGNVPALVRLIQAFVVREPTTFTTRDVLEPVLGIFQKLISSKVNDNFGFDLLETLYSCLAPAALETYNQQIFLLLLTRLNNSRTEKFTLRFTIFSYYLAALTVSGGPDFFISIMEAIQSGIFSQIFSGMVLPSTQKILNPSDSKTVSIGLTNFMTQSSFINDKGFPQLWLEFLTCQLKFLELPAQATTEGSELLDLDLEDSGFQASFAGLRTSARSRIDPWQSIKDPKQYFVEQLNHDHAGANRYAPLIVSSVPNDMQIVLRKYGVQF